MAAKLVGDSQGLDLAGSGGPIRTFDSHLFIFSLNISQASFTGPGHTQGVGI